MISVDAQPIDGNLAIDAQNQYGNHADYLDVNAIIQHGRIAVDAYEKPAGLQCYIPLFNTISPWWGELALDAGSHVRASVAKRTNPVTGLIESVANNIPRFEKHDNLLALLDEPIGQNLIHYSHELGNAASGGWWADTRLTSVIADGMLAPDGNVVADGLVADVNNNSHHITSALIPGIAQNDKVVLTAFAKPGDEDWVYLRVRFFDIGDAYLGDRGAYFFNVSTGAIGTIGEAGSATVHDYKIEAVANGFYRIGLIVSNNDGNTSKVDGQLYAAPADGFLIFTGDATTVNTWFWEADLMKQDFFSSPVPTSGGTVTRATESGYPLWDLPLGLFNAEGLASVWVRFGWGETDMPQDGTRTNSGIIVTRDNASSLVFVEHDSDFVINASFSSFDGTIWAIREHNFIANTWYKLVIKWSSTTSKMRAGYDSGAGIDWGVEVAFDGSYTLGTSLRLAFGLFGPMWLHKLMIWDYIPTDIEINAHHGSP